MANNNKKKKSNDRKSGIVVIVLAVGIAAFLNIYQVSFIDFANDAYFLNDFLDKATAVAAGRAASTASGSKNDGKHRVAGLDCTKYAGGPPNDIAQEMVYWRDLPSDAQYQSPFAATKNGSSPPQYLTFEPDEGGWNNIRMGMETAVMMAISTGRILVLPPEQKLYLLHHGHDKKVFGFKDFFHFDSLVEEHPSLEIISFQEFVEREALTGNLKDTRTGKPSYPPFNSTLNLDMGHNYQKKGSGAQLWRWLRNCTTNIDWSYGKCVASFPSKRNDQDSVNELKQALEIVLQADAAAYPDVPLERRGRSRMNRFDNKPTPVNSNVKERLAEMLAERWKLCIYDTHLQNANVIHLKGEESSGSRMLVHFYAFLFHQDWQADLWMKRFVRDHLRYVDELQCAAARVVAAVRKVAKQNGSPDGLYDSFHIRRGDFQYKEMHMTALDIYENNTRRVLRDGVTVYVATDEKDDSYFKDLAKHYHLVFLKDFMDELGHDFNPNYFGMVDQLVASRGRIFFGAYFSTFTGYINRLRGYHHQKMKGVGHELGLIDSFYYTPRSLSHKRRILRKYVSIRQGFWNQEFAVSWRDIDHDVPQEELDADDAAASRVVVKRR